MGNSLSVGLGEQVVSKNPEDILVAYGLGSCLGIGIFDPIARVAGLVHAVLPERLSGGDPNSSKYVSCAITNLIDEMCHAGADRSRLLIRMAGGANMLISPAVQKSFDIGTRNVAAAHETLQKLNFRLRAEEVGGNIGRTVRLYVVTGRMTVRVIGGQEHDI